MIIVPVYYMCNNILLYEYTPHTHPTIILYKKIYSIYYNI